MHRSRSAVAVLVATWSVALYGPPCGAELAPALPPPIRVVLPSALPSGIPVNDRIPVTLYPAATATGAPAPAVVMLHPLGVIDNDMMRGMARYFAQHGIASALMTLPYHMERRSRGTNTTLEFCGPDLDRDARALDQSASDTSTVVDWLQTLSCVDPRRIGVVGISLGAVVAHLAMGRDQRLTAGVAILGGGNLKSLYSHSLLFNVLKIFHDYPRHQPNAVWKRLRRVDPLAYADRNRPRHVLMVQAARDLIMPASCSVPLWKALGRPPILWLDTNHYGPILATRELTEVSADYLLDVWGGRPVRVSDLPHVSAPAIKVGLLFGLDSTVTPAVQAQVVTVGRWPSRVSLFHGDLGWSGRGPFAAAGVTVNDFVDVGIAQRLTGQSARMYVSLHLVL